MELKYLIENKKEIIRLKKSATKSHIEGIKSEPSQIIQIENKSVEDNEEVINRTIIGNTYNYLDNHGDVHADKCFSKSISENVPFILHDHKQDLTGKIGMALSTSELAIKWSDFGIDKEGETTSLISDVEIIKALNPNAFYQYKNNMVNQHSVGMQYVTVDLAINDSYDKEGFANWGKYLPLLGNSEKAEDCGFFFIVKEAKLFEISAVLQGSNSLTGVISSEQMKNDIEKIYKKFGDIDKFYEFCRSTLNFAPVDATKNEEPQKKNYYKLLIKK